MRPMPVVATMLLAVFVSGGAGQEPKPPAGLDTYLFGILRAGETQAPAGDEANKLQAGHRQNMERMAEAGILVGAGPLIDAGDYRGIFIFKKDARGKIDEMIKGDPLIESGRLVLELLPWWGPEKIGARYFDEKRSNPEARDRMVTYQLAFLLEGTHRAQGKEDAERIQAAHMAHINKMADAGHLVAAGPFLEEGKLRGVYVFKLPSVEEARAIAAEDPAVKAGRLVLEIYGWMVAEGVLPPPKTTR